MITDRYSDAIWKLENMPDLSSIQILTGVSFFKLLSIVELHVKLRCIMKADLSYVKGRFRPAYNKKNCTVFSVWGRVWLNKPLFLCIYISNRTVNCAQKSLIYASVNPV